MFKPLRIMLAIAAVLLIIFATAPGTEVKYEGFAVFTTLIIPVIAPMIFFVILLDSLMIRVFMIDQTGEKRKQMRLALTVNLLLAAGLLVQWLPYIRAI